MFALAQLMVAPSHRRDHIATRLLRRLLERVDADVVTSLVEPANAAVAAAYESWGWTRAGRVAAPTAGAPELEAWSRRARH
ncbi:GNAT family N-acetyltransferase [Streptomyces sp. M19]